MISALAQSSFLNVANTEETTTVTADIFRNKNLSSRKIKKPYAEKNSKRDLSCKGQDIPKNESRTVNSLPKRIARPAAPILCLMKITAVRFVGSAYRSTMQNGLCRKINNKRGITLWDYLTKNTATSAGRKSDFSETASWRTGISARTVQENSRRFFQRAAQLNRRGH